MGRPRRALSPAEEMKFLAGLVAQPFVTGVLAFVAFPVLLLDRNGRSLAGGFPSDVTDTAVSMAVGAALVALVVTLLALPIAAWRMTQRPVDLREALLFGLGLGNLPFVLGSLLAGTYGVAGVFRGIAFSSVLALAGAAVFWAIALRGQSQTNA